MQEVPRAVKCPIAIQFWAHMLLAMKLAYGPVHHGYEFLKVWQTDGQTESDAYELIVKYAQVGSKITSKGMDVEVLVTITDRGF